MTTVEMEPTVVPVKIEEPKSIPQSAQVTNPSTKTESPANDEPLETPTKAEESAAETPADVPSAGKTDEAAAVDKPQDGPLDGQLDGQSGSLPTRLVNHTHSYSYAPPSSSLKEAITSRKTNSTTEIPIIATDNDDPAFVLPTPIRRLPSSLSSSSIEDQDISTIPDPRIRAQKLASGTMNDEQQDDEVTTLSTKLIDAINHQSSLDDSLSQARLDLEESREKVRKLEELSARQKEFLEGGVWVRKTSVEEEKAKILAKAREDRRLRVEAEEVKKRMELELETLTAELFEQANLMVSEAKEEARKEQLAAARRYDGLKAQLADTEGLLKSQQEQLAELKQVMEEMIRSEALARDDQTTALTTPTSPGFDQFDFKESDGNAAATANEAGIAPKTKEAADNGDGETTSSGAKSVATVAAATVATAAFLSPATLVTQSSPDAVPLSPAQPMSFTHLLRPVLRHDTSSFHEFVELIRTAQIHLMLQQRNTPQTHMRSPSSTSLPKTPPLNSPSWNGTSAAGLTASSSASGSVVPMSAVNAFATVASGIAVSSSSSSPQNHAKELKETKFYKRVLVEDIDPTLRLDTAPGVSWLVRRNIMAAIVEGTLAAEPVPNTVGAALIIQAPCSLCGESRLQDGFLRHHRFRLTESDKSTPYPLCNYCLGRVRSVCGFLVFLRMIKEGHWRANDEETEQAAWEECVRLREQMFWARIGGGVLPTVGGNSSGGIASFSTGSGSGVGFVRHSRSAGSGSGVHHALSFQANGQVADSVLSSPISGRPSGDFGGQASTPSKMGVSSSPLPSPLSTVTGSGLGIKNGDAPSSQSQPTSPPAKMSSSVAAMVAGLGGHVV